jgi:hypothetical protein
LPIVKQGVSASPRIKQGVNVSLILKQGVSASPIIIYRDLLARASITRRKVVSLNHFSDMNVLALGSHSLQWYYNHPLLFLKGISCELEIS